MTSVVTALSVVFIAIFIYSWLMTSRQKRLEKKLDELKAQLKDKV
jgi:CcmD family protein